uniref:unspecific monooxygenase n=1 Tax=Bombyx mori TaxID=7091 RepID=L0N722_BOMMO|nr:cytochrome P450 [Bombyx mori]BAM73821.1 cytochrome P450 [Bombyx mori]
MNFSPGTVQILQFIQNDWKLILILTLLIFIYYYYTNTFDYFEKRGVPFKKPIIFLGNLGPRLKAAKSFHQYQLDIYQYFKGHPYGGTFDGRRPVLHILDPELIKAIMIRDFDHFTDRNTLNSMEPRYLSRSLLNLKGLEWKGVRSTLTPAFSSSRLKNMIPLIQQCSKQMVEFLRKFDGKEIEMKQTMGHFTLEVIGACAFGIKCDALSNENSRFVKVAEKFDYMPKYKRVILLMLLVFMPKMIRYLRLSFLNIEYTGELVRMLQAAKAERRSSESKKGDFLQVLIDFAAKETAQNDTAKREILLDDDTIDAQSLLFLIAGYETSSTLLSFAIHVLATKPDLQETLRAHVQEMTKGKELSYELLSQMDYLEAFLQETLRIYPPVARVDRICTKPYIIPGTTVHVGVGDAVAIPVYGLHMDEDIYPEPREFKPERFMDDQKKDRPSHLYLPFGAGPRNCIGLRFAMISAKIAMVALMKNFKFSVCSKTMDPTDFDKRAVLLKSAKGLWVRIELIDLS